MISELKKNLITLFVLLCFTRPVICCVARTVSPSRRPPRTAFYLHQKVPNIHEFSQGASGRPTEPIRYGSPAFKQLKINYNPGIVFEHTPERSGDTRRMTKKCREALNRLEKLVKEKWPTIKLRVISAWDEETSHRHSTSSLHYEGRAVDITTSDTDSSKLGLLARLAVEAGFDWVKYVQKFRVHASVRVDSKDDTTFKDTGCFRSNSTIRLVDGKTKTMNKLKIGDRVQSMNKDGEIVYSEIAMFLDNKPNKKDVLFFVIRTVNPSRELYLTKSHLIYVRRRYSSFWKVQFAKMVQKGDFVKVFIDGKLVAAEVTDISVSNERGSIAPLTNEGNIIVDGVLASCYALLEDHDLADSIFWPAKVMYRHFPSLLNSKNTPQNGVHWYARVMLFLNEYFSVLT